LSTHQNRRPGLASALGLVLVAALATLPRSAAGEVAAGDSPGCTEVGGIDYLLKQRTLLLLGEMPGTVESPRFVADLLCNVVASGHTVAIALQLPEFESGALARYLESAGSREDREQLLTGARELALYRDGRFSEAMLGLVESIRSLRARGAEIAVTLFVPSGIDSLTRQKLSAVERPMAEKIWYAATESEVDLFIVLAGLTHTRLIRGNLWDPEHQPMGWELAQWHTEWRLLSLALSHSGGNAWVCTSNQGIDCRAVPVQGGGWGEPNHVYIYGDVTETGYDGVYYVGEISSSPPARANSVEPDFEGKQITELPFEP
jgi:hypothetical protein